MNLTVTKVERIRRAKKSGTSASTARSFTRVFFNAEGYSTSKNVENSDKKVHSILRKLMPEALKRAGMNPDEKFSWNEIAGNQKGNLRQGFIMREDKGFELQVTYGLEGTPQQTDVKEVYSPSQLKDQLCASLNFAATDCLAA